jgi:hypothetical protein
LCFRRRYINKVSLRIGAARKSAGQGGTTPSEGRSDETQVDFGYRRSGDRRFHSDGGDPPGASGRNRASARHDREPRGVYLTLKTREGPNAALALKPEWKVFGVTAASVSDIKPGDFVGITSLPGSAGGDGAIEVHIFLPAMKGTGEGSYPWDLKPKTPNGLRNPGDMRSVRQIARKTKPERANE